MLMIDSNIWAYYFDKTTPEHKPVRNTVNRALHEGEILINTVIQIEVAHYLIKRLGAILGKEKLDVFLRYPFKVDELSKSLVRDSVEILQRYTHMGIGGRDATILATMKKYNIAKLITHDNGLKKVDWVDAIDPIGKKR